MRGEVTRNPQQLLPITAAEARAEEAREEVARADDDVAIDQLLTVLVAIYRLRRKELIVELDVQGSHLSEAMNEAATPSGDKGKKQLQLRWLPVFQRLCPPELREQLRDAIVGLVGGGDEQLTPEEEREAKDEALVECGLAGQRAVAAARERIVSRRKRSSRR